MKVTMLTVSSMIHDTRIQSEAKTLLQAGYSVTILYIEDQDTFYSLPNPELTWKNYLDTMNGINTVRYFLNSRRWRALPTILNKAFQAVELFFKFSWGVLSHRADIYHCHDLTPAIFAWLGKLVYRSHIVYDAHELEVESTETSSSFIKKIKKWYERVTVAKSSIVITVNSYIANIMKVSYGKEVNVVANKPIYVKKEELDPSLLRTAATLKKSDKIVLYVGNLNLARGLSVMVKALSHLPENVYFLLMGTGRINEYKKILFELAKSGGIDINRIVFVGPFQPQDVVKYLSGADVSIMLYQSNTANSVMNAPNKLFQSVMARVPIIASNNTSFPKFLFQNPCGTIGEVVDETKPEAVANQIVEVLKPENNIFYKKNLDCYAAQIGWDVEAKLLVKLYSRLA